jgi:polyphosphate:AMP phosphotransferase
MFEAAELGRQLGKRDYKEQEPVLRVGLLTVQYELRDSDFPLVLVLTGDDRPGLAEVINLLHEWMDPRLLEANVYEELTQEEAERPRFWRYWRSLPARGRIGIFHREWTSRAIVERVVGIIDEEELERRIRHIQGFEKALVDDGALVVKLWLHTPRSALKKTLKRAQKDKTLAWQVSKEDRFVYEHYRELQSVAENVLRQTSRDGVLWDVVESTDERYRNVTVAQILLKALTKRLAEPPRARPRVPPSGEPNPLTVLDQVDLSKSLSKKTYEDRLHRGWKRLAKASRKAHEAGMATVLAFEGWDAAGKGGVIRRVTRAMDAAHYRVIPIAAPTEDEKAHHYLWRFWRQLPRAGHVAIFDRSWYGRVLVERLEGLTYEEEWKRAYSEINDFEEQLVRRGILVVKFWMHISPEEQLRRFELREKVPFKKYKITEDDYRNRSRWSDYEAAADEMIERTSTEYARWNLVAGNDKRWARVAVLRTLCKRMELALGTR